ncbi:decarboxylase [Amycolatopsis sp. K13G38]|uniref:Decarboxylase n=1 Tax=Amycolatopsis acididurans TaxID=2724524 RepID=A0ABX1J4K5_9PSEU|nr:decarboxylase [Amycolatopsis acididurans]NKQ54726.1 decarboxylase [Amycolatopsis acididurans]
MRIGLVYPTANTGEDDFLRLAARTRPALDVEVVYFPWPEDIGDLSTLDTDQVVDAVRRLGSAAHLQRVLPAALDGRDVDVVAYAVTSASFVDGPDGVEDQLRVLRRLADCPAMSTTAAFQQAIRSLGLRTVALASVYHPEVSAHFVERVREAGAEIVRRVDASGGSERELARWSPERIVDLVRRAAHPRAQAVLLPETALHTSEITADLERAAGCPVLTATQVTLWAAARLAGIRAVSEEAGPLFAPSGFVGPRE